VQDKLLGLRDNSGMARPQLSPVIAKLRQSLELHEVWQGKVLVAVSGGPDSIAMLLGLHEVAAASGLSLLVGHLNHRLRGPESDEDAAFVEQFCRERSILCIIDSVSPDTLQPGQAHLESAARRLRYQWLASLAERESCQWVMTGHTANDQAETVLHHLLRGTGLRGLRGIAPRRWLDGKLLVRPLLQTTRQEVECFLSLREIIARRDQSNFDPRFKRNLLRQMVLPVLNQKINPHAVQHLAQMADRAREFCSLIHRRARRLLRLAELPPVGEVQVFDQRLLQRADPTTLQEAMLQLWTRQDWPVSAMSSQRWREVMEVCRGERPQVQLPAGVMVRQKLHVVHFFRPDVAG
jgi:tRNA(Ile)-lysidine synthase